MLYLFLAVMALGILGFVSRSKRKQEIANHDWDDEEDRDTLPFVRTPISESDLAVIKVLDHYNSINPNSSADVVEMDDDVEDDDCDDCNCDCDFDEPDDDDGDGFGGGDSGGGGADGDF